MKIIIAQFAFEISEPSVAGQAKTAAEAQALNALRADRIRELVRKRIARQAFSLSQLEALVAQIDAEWDWPSPRSPVTRLSRLEIEIGKVAEELARRDNTQEGLPLEGPEFDSYVEELAQESSVREEAQRRLDIQSRVASSTLEDLLA